MKLETFFKKFELFADAPNAVQRMRELVLNLAVQGKLVEQDANDEPASVLIEKIERAKQKLISDRAIKRQETAPITEEEYPFAIPDSWVWTRLGAIGDWGSGSTPPRGNHDFYGGDMPWLKSGELNDNQSLAGSEETVTALALKTCSFRLNKPGDVLLAMYGATIGKVAILAESAVTNQAVCGCTPFDGVSNRYLFNYLVSQRSNFHLASEGGAQPNISKVKIVSFPFPLPPLSEQKRIVAKADELMALCDRLDAQQNERQTRHTALARAAVTRFADAPAPANLDFIFHNAYAITPADLRKTILALAVQGKLVPQDTNDEQPKELVRMRVMKATSLKSDRFTPFELPNNWQWVQLGQVSELINGDRSKNYPNKAEYVRKGVAWINTGHIEPDGALSTDSMHYITREKFDSLRSGKVRPGDLVYCLRGATLGKTAIITQFDEGAVASSLVIIRLLSAVDPIFAYRVLTSPLGRQQIFQFDNGSAQPNLSANNVKKYWIPLPPLAEQRRIVAKVYELMKLVDQLEAQLAASTRQAEQLMQAIVGGLVGTS